MQRTRGPFAFPAGRLLFLQEERELNKRFAALCGSICLCITALVCGGYLLWVWVWPFALWGGIFCLAACMILARCIRELYTGWRRR